ERSVSAVASAVLCARRSHLALEIFETARDGVALRGRRRELTVADGAAVIVLRDLRLQLGLARVEVLELALEARAALLGRQIRAEQRVGQNRGEKNAGGDEEPRKRGARTVGHEPDSSRCLLKCSRGASELLRPRGAGELPGSGAPR